MGGVECFAGSVLDLSLGNVDDYEAEMQAALRRHVKPGDRVRIVGGGYGVTAVVALGLGAETVEVVEATREGVNCCRRTIQYNTQIEGQPAISARRWSVEHGVVGELVDPWGTDIGSTRSVEWCRDADVLEVDCEGGEGALLDELDQDGPLPRVLLVESHGELGSPTTRVREQVESLGYTVVSSEYEEEAEDVAVLSCVRENGR